MSLQTLAVDLEMQDMQEFYQKRLSSLPNRAVCLSLCRTRSLSLSLTDALLLLSFIFFGVLFELWKFLKPLTAIHFGVDTEDGARK